MLTYNIKQNKESLGKYFTQTDADYVVVVGRVGLCRVSRYAKWFTCPLVYHQGALISQSLRSEVGSGLGALPEMDHRSGCGVSTVISVLKPAPIVGLFSS